MSTAAHNIAEIDRRRAILAALMVAPAYMMPARGLREQIGLVGYVASLEKLRCDCDMLADLGLITWQNDVAILSDRGADVVLGRLQIGAVKRPEPGQV